MKIFQLDHLKWTMTTNVYHSLVMDKYNGKDDPMYHLAKYMTQMKSKKASPALKCQRFHLTLHGSAKT